MTELPRLSTASSDEFELALLRSAETEAPSRGALGRTAAALGIGAGSLIVPTSAAAAASGAPTAVSGAAWVTLLKVGALSFASGLLVVSGIAAVSSRSVSQPASPTLAATSQQFAATSVPARSSALPPRAETASDPLAADAPAPTPTSKRSAPGSDGPVAAAERAAAPQPAGPAASPTPAVPLPATAAPAPVSTTASTTAAVGTLPDAPSPTSSISEEVASIDRARAALARGQARDALVELERYRTRWPHGVLALDALVVRVEAEVKLGDRAGAEREAAPVIAAYPQSRYAAQLRALLGSH